MLIADDGKGQLIRATPDAKACCPDCRSPLIPKCGELVTWHWAHEAAASACSYEGESEWHLTWKEWALEQGCRIEKAVVPGFRADIVTPHGRIIELQSKPLSAAETEAREDAYGDSLVWVFKVTDEQEERLLWGDKTYGRDGKGFFWRRGPKRLAHCTAPIYLDLAQGLFLVRSLSLDEVYYEDWNSWAERLTGWGQPSDYWSLFQVPDPALRREHRFCKGHGSWFCPCVAPYLYSRDPVGAAAWPALA